MGEIIMANQFLILKNVIISPFKAFAEICKEPKKFILGGIIIAVIIPFLLNLFVSLSPMMVIYSAISMVLGWILIIVLMYFLGRWIFRGKSSFNAMLSSVSYASFPNIIKSVLTIPLFVMAGETILQLAKMQGASPDAILPLAQQLVTPGIIILFVIIGLLSVWTIVLWVMACMQAHKIKAWKAIIIFIIAMIIEGIIVNLVLSPMTNTAISSL
jgi:hypothetical protein